jgi:hypothetical protein
VICSPKLPEGNREGTGFREEPAGSADTARDEANDRTDALVRFEDA